jgi:hypothetical protein
MILELNARPGLNIQLANGDGLLRRLVLVEKHLNRLASLTDRISFAKENFAVVHKRNGKD